jgi:hypothetical protein
MLGGDPGASVAWLGDTVWQLSAPFTFLPGSPPRISSSLQLDVLDRTGARVGSPELAEARCEECVFVGGLRRLGDRVALVYRRTPLTPAEPAELRLLLFSAAGERVNDLPLEVTAEPRVTLEALQGLSRQDALLLASGDRLSVAGPDLAPLAGFGPLRASSAAASWNGDRGLFATWTDERRNVLSRRAAPAGAPYEDTAEVPEVRVSTGTEVISLAAGAESLGLVFADGATRLFAWLGTDGSKRGGDLVLARFERERQGALASTRGLLLPLGGDRFAYFGVVGSGLIREEVACAAR